MKIMKYFILALAFIAGLNTRYLMAQSVQAGAITAPSISANHISSSRDLSIEVVSTSIVLLIGALIKSFQKQEPLYNQIERPEPDEHEETYGVHHPLKDSKVQEFILTEPDVVSDFDPETSTAESSEVKRILEFFVIKEHEIIDNDIPSNSDLLNTALDSEDEDSAVLVIEVTLQPSTTKEISGSSLEETAGAYAYSPEEKDKELEHFKQELELRGFSQSKLAYLTLASLMPSVFQRPETKGNQAYVDSSEVSGAIVYCPSLKDSRYGLDPNIKQADIEKYTCPICEDILKDAVQTECGHWTCEMCFPPKITGSEKCPRTDCAEQIKTQKSDEGGNEKGVRYIDRSVRNEIDQWFVICKSPECNWRCSGKEIETEIVKHYAITHPVRTCVLGCPGEFDSEASLRKHIEENSVTHLMLSAAKMNDMTKKIAELSNANTALSHDLTALKEQVSSRERTIDVQSTQIKHLNDRITQMISNVMENECLRDLRLSCLEIATYDGHFTWKLSLFSQEKAKAESDGSKNFFSTPFYTHKEGYKVCLNLYIMGDGIGKNTHMSLYLVVMKGNFDSILTWPFDCEVIFQLINQTGHENIIDGFHSNLDPTNADFQQPEHDMNNSVGCQRFVCHTDLTEGEFIVNDTIFIKCEVVDKNRPGAFMEEIEYHSE